MACGSNPQLCPLGHTTPRQPVTCAIISSNRSIEKVLLSHSPFSFFVPCVYLFLFVSCLFCSRHTCWGSRPGRPQIPGLGGLLSLVDTSACRALSSLTAGSCRHRGDGCGLESAAAQLRAGSPPLQMVEMTPLERQASPTSPQHTQGPAAHFFSPPVVSSCCSLVKNERKDSEAAPCYYVTAIYILEL